QGLDFNGDGVRDTPKLRGVSGINAFKGDLILYQDTLGFTVTNNQCAYSQGAICVTNPTTTFANCPTCPAGRPAHTSNVTPATGITPLTCAEATGCPNPPRDPSMPAASVCIDGTNNGGPCNQANPGGVNADCPGGQCGSFSKLLSTFASYPANPADSVSNPAQCPL